MSLPLLSTWLASSRPERRISDRQLAKGEPAVALVTSASFFHAVPNSAVHHGEHTGRKSGPFSVSPDHGRQGTPPTLRLTLRVRGLPATGPAKPLSVREKVPIVAMMRFPSVDRTATIAISMKVDRPGTICLHPLGPKQRGGRPATAFLARDAKPKAAEKSWRRTLQVQDRGDAFVAGLRSDLIQSSSWWALVWSAE